MNDGSAGEIELVSVRTIEITLCNSAALGSGP